MAQLESGLYTIRSGDATIGRARHEALDLSPKAVFAHTDDQDAVWVVEAYPDDRYRLYAKGAPTAVADLGPAGPLVSLLLDQGDAPEWKLVPVDGAPATYRITSPQGSSWTVLEPGKQSQIEVIPVLEGSTAFTFRRIGH
ncbi:I66 family serine proteinase inhibitor [Kitasatospora sp. NPDC004799]|uniref:I66 family serine proteinase inhibitor n=1 Tax=Kitasatospora sp. NPDC004799 TaxID=3154460 RepID=UPI0033A82364